LKKRCQGRLAGKLIGCFLLHLANMTVELSAGSIQSRWIATKEVKDAWAAFATDELARTSTG
jgi:hypothetical protein